MRPDRWLRRAAAPAALVVAGPLAASGFAAPGTSAGAAIRPLAERAPVSAAHPAGSGPSTCLTPAPTVDYTPIHCYTPAQIDAAYGIDQVHAQGLKGQGRTIVAVDAYGSPTATNDIDHFASAFGLPKPDFSEVYPLGRPDYSNAQANSNGLSGPAAAAGWAGEATLDIEWADAVAPDAHIVLLATPPAETEGVQGIPNMMKAIQWAISTYPSGTVFSMSFGADESSFGGGSAASQFATFDQTFQAGIAKGDTFFSSAGDSGTTGTMKQHKETATSPNPAVSYPNDSPYVTSVGGTQLQYGWTWDPTSDTAFTPSGGFNPQYFNSTSSGNSEAVWNESWLPAASGGGASTVYPRPSWQKGVLPAMGNHRLVPDIAWNAAVNGGVLVYETYPPAWTGYAGYPAWQPVGGTSAASPQAAALTALADQARIDAGEQPIGWLNPLLYTDPALGPSATSGFAGSGAFRDIVAHRYGTVPAGDLNGNQLWQVNSDGSVSPGPVPGEATTPGYNLTTGWGTPRAPGYVAALTSAP